MKYSVKNFEVEVDPAFIKNDEIKWNFTGNGEYIIGEKDGEKWFIKRNIHVRLPDRSTPKDLYDLYKAPCDAIEKKQNHLYTLMKDLDWKKDHIVKEENHFWDKNENMFVTVTHCVPDTLDGSYDYTSLNREEFVELAQKTAEALTKLHAHDVIHGDLKEKNIVVSDKDGTLTPYLIDFDTSYPRKEIPEEKAIGGSEGYQSPEVLLYSEGEVGKDAITSAVDIYSLGVVFHRWWTGTSPKFDSDDKVTVNRKFNVCIGDDCGATIQSLINWMLAKDAGERPTAQQVDDVLLDKEAVPEKFHTGKDYKLFEDSLWDEHNEVAALLPTSEMKAKGIKAFKRFNDGRGSNGLKYEIKFNDGNKVTMSVTELCDNGYATRKAANIDEPWEDDGIEFESAEVIAEKGYTAIRRKLFFTRKSYDVINVSGSSYERSRNWLLKEGLAHIKEESTHSKAIEIEVDTPWPEHGKEYDKKNMEILGIKSISKTTSDSGEHCYRIVYNQLIDGKNKVNENVSIGNIKLMGFIK